MVFPLVPIAVGGAAALASGLGSYFANRRNTADLSKQPTQQIPRLAPNQLQAQDLALQQVMDILKGGGGVGGNGFAPIEKEARRGFEQQTLPSIANRYTAQFGPGQRQSSGFGQINQQAGQDFETQLAAMKANYQNNILGNLLNFGGAGRFDTLVNQPQQGLFSSALSGLAPTIGTALPLLAANQFSGQQQPTNAGGGFDQGSLAQIVALLSQQNQGNNLRFNQPSQGVFGNQTLAPQGFQPRLAGF